MATGSNTVSTGTAGARSADRTAADRTAEAAQAAEERPAIAEHVAAADEQEPVRSASSTQGTLVDTYL